MASSGDIEKVLAATDIVALISEHIPLHNKGREMVGLCPFHDGSSPAMMASVRSC